MILMKSFTKSLSKRLKIGKMMRVNNIDDQFYKIRQDDELFNYKLMELK